MSSSPFVIGDRVMERSHDGRPVVAKPGSPSFNKVCAYMREVRAGEVINLEERRIKSGSKCLYIQVRWDGYQSTSWHARHRLLPAQPTAPLAEANTLAKQNVSQ